MTNSETQTSELLGAEAVRPSLSDPESSASKPEKRGLWEWLTLSRARAEANAALRARSPRERDLERRARLSLELADRAFAPVEPLRAGSGSALAAELYAEAIYWLLNVVSPEPPEQSAEALWAAWAERYPKFVFEPRVKGLVTGQRCFILAAELDETEQLRLATELRTTACEMLAELEAPQRTVRELRARFWTRLGVLAGLALASVGGGVFAANHLVEKPNLALGKPFRTSSVWAECQPELRKCGGVDSAIFFHTKDDPSPWIEYDFGVPTSFSSLTIRNRSDYGPDRAIPLLVEISDDGQNYKEIAHRKESFRTWKPSFPRQTARYLRLRVPRRTWLHLEKVEVHP